MQCEKGSDVSNFLLIILTSSIQVRNFCCTTVIISLSLGYQPHWIFPCSIYNLMIFSGQGLLIFEGPSNTCMFVLCMQRAPDQGLTQWATPGSLASFWPSEALAQVLEQVALPSEALAPVLQQLAWQDLPPLPCGL